MSYEVNRSDILAMIDVLNELGEVSDQLDASSAARMRGAIGQLKAKVTEVFQLLDSQLAKMLDGQPVEVDGAVFMVKDKQSYVPDQSSIARSVVRQAAVDSNGEMCGAVEAAERAVRLMADLYVSASTEPKVGGLKALGLSKVTAGEWKTTGKVVHEVVTRAAD